ncbi:MAG: hypothetical protein ACFFE2_09135 [Candidatus Thorarchaeota archaeon]
MGDRSRFLLETWIIASMLALINLILALVIHILTSTNFDFFTAANLSIPEFGVLLIIGSCLMSRQPLDDAKKHDSEGKPTPSWQRAQLGQRILLGSIFLLAFAGFYYILGISLPP